MKINQTNLKFTNYFLHLLCKYYAIDLGDVFTKLFGEYNEVENTQKGGLLGDLEVRAVVIMCGAKAHDMNTEFTLNDAWEVVNSVGINDTIWVDLFHELTSALKSNLNINETEVAKKKTGVKTAQKK